MPTKPEELIYAGAGPLRLDRFLAGRFPGVSRAYLQGLIARGLVKVNGRRGRKGTPLSPGDRVEIGSFLRPEEREIGANGEIPLEIVRQSEEFLVVEKPAGLATHPNEYGERETLANALLGRFPELRAVGDDPLRPGIVHRLDRDTSGLLLVARTQEAFRRLRALFAARRIGKSYLALVLGDVAEAGEIRTPIAHHPRNPRKMVAALPGRKIRSRPREARTLYEPVERFGAYTLLSVRTLTGRMHQVRVHLSSVGHPLAGDRLYQSGGQRSSDRSGLARHFLHACALDLPAETGGRLRFESRLPDELEACLRALRGSR